MTNEQKDNIEVITSNKGSIEDSDKDLTFDDVKPNLTK